MNDWVIVDKDLLQFNPLFGNRTVSPVGPAMIGGSGHAVINGRKVCIRGDEGKVKINAVYTTPTHSIPGSGLITITRLAANQLARHAGSGQPLIIKGQQFIAQFRPTQPAQMPGTPPTPDVPAPSMGQGVFVPSQWLVQAG